MELLCPLYRWKQAQQRAEACSRSHKGLWISRAQAEGSFGRGARGREQRPQGAGTGQAQSYSVNTPPPLRRLPFVSFYRNPEMGLLGEMPFSWEAVGIGLRNDPRP